MKTNDKYIGKLASPLSFSGSEFKFGIVLGYDSMGLWKIAWFGEKEIIYSLYTLRGVEDRICYFKELYLK